MANHNTPTPTVHPAPHSVEAEQAVLRSSLIDPKVILRVSPLLHADNSFVVKNGWMWHALHALCKQWEPVDLLMARVMRDRNHDGRQTHASRMTATRSGLSRYTRLNLTHDPERAFPGVGEFHSAYIRHKIVQAVLPVLLKLGAAA